IPWVGDDPYGHSRPLKPRRIFANQIRRPVLGAVVYHQDLGLREPGRGQVLRAPVQSRQQPRLFVVGGNDYRERTPGSRRRTWQMTIVAPQGNPRACSIAPRFLGGGTYFGAKKTAP